MAAHALRARARRARDAGAGRGRGGPGRAARGRLRRLLRRGAVRGRRAGAGDAAGGQRGHARGGAGRARRRSRPRRRAALPDAFVRPPPAIRAAAAGEGLANVTVARDSVVRGLPLLLRAGDERVPAMALTLAALYARRPAVLDGEPRAGVVHAAGRSIPVSDGDIMAINFLGPPSTAEGRGPVPIIPFVNVPRRLDRSLMRDRIALIGPTIRGVDEHPTPTSTQTRMWGVEILANAVETVITSGTLCPRPGG